MAESPLLIERRDAVAWLTLNRPARMNCFDQGLKDELIAALDALAGDRALRALVITGSGRAFCSGQDLRERHVGLQAGEPDLGAALETGFNRIVLALRGLEVPTVALVNGVAAGAGASLALACDFVVAARSARFIQSFVDVGLLPDGGGTWTLPRLVGAARARGLALLAEPLAADDAERWGLIWRSVDDAELTAAGETLVAALCRRPRHALAAIKRALDASLGNDLDAQLDLEAALQRNLGRDPFYRMAVERFVAARDSKERS